MVGFVRQGRIFRHVAGNGDTGAKLLVLYKCPAVYTHFHARHGVFERHNGVGVFKFFRQVEMAAFFGFIADIDFQVMPGIALEIPP
ncbi:MAG: hypothetical protein ACQERN_14005 [Thermodesulfobacteriota bacterium]